MGTIANIALSVAALAIVPSAGPWTPAVFFSALAALVAVPVIVSGNIRRGILTVYLALSAVVVSPMFADLPQVDIWLVVLIAIGGIGGTGS